MSAAQKILKLLSNDQWWPGLQLVEASKGGVSRWSVYAHLSQMEDAGLVRHRELPVDPIIGIARREYQITPKGRSEQLRYELNREHQ